MLKPDGIACLGAMTPSGAANLVLKDEQFRTYDEVQLTSILAEAGFLDVDVEMYQDSGSSLGEHERSRIFLLALAKKRSS